MKNMFESCETLTNLEVSGFITSNVTNMSYNILSLSSKLISLKLENMGTSKLTNTEAKFSDCQ